VWVALKILNNSQGMNASFTKEIENNALLNDSELIVKCFGISQDPVTKNYVMVMQYIPNGSMKKYLEENYSKLNFEDKLGQLIYITRGLKSIHSQRLVHRDFHPGNILKHVQSSYISDLGLSRPTNEEDDNKVYGILPYIAPEVLRGQLYTQKSDIYSFGIVAYEIMSGLSPYVVYDEKEKCYKEIPHDISLSLAICQGLRPRFRIKIPQLLKDLIERC